jgi:hypothetical protein
MCAVITLFTAVDRARRFGALGERIRSLLWRFMRPTLCSGHHEIHLMRRNAHFFALFI